MFVITWQFSVIYIWKVGWHGTWALEKIHFLNPANTREGRVCAHVWEMPLNMVVFPSMDNRYVYVFASMCVCLCTVFDIQLRRLTVLGKDKLAAHTGSDTPRPGCYFLPGVKVTTVMNDKPSIIYARFFSQPHWEQTIKSRSRMLNPVCCPAILHLTKDCLQVFKW